jgi:hypothetical protein
MRRWRRVGGCGLMFSWLTLAGCGAVNPDLLGTVGGNPAAQINPIDGHVAFLIINNSSTPIAVNVDVVQKNGYVASWTLTMGEEDYFPVIYTCQLVSFNVSSYGYFGLDGFVEESSNLGTLYNGQSFFCGEVVTVIAEGTPPRFSVAVY